MMSERTQVEESLAVRRGRADRPRAQSAMANRPYLQIVDHGLMIAFYLLPVGNFRTKGRACLK
jgi:hypothetical protein